MVYGSLCPKNGPEPSSSLKLLSTHIEASAVNPRASIADEGYKGLRLGLRV